jgi:hypothetical protein
LRLDTSRLPQNFSKRKNLREYLVHRGFIVVRYHSSVESEQKGRLMDPIREKLEEEIDRIRTVDIPAWPYDEQGKPVEDFEYIPAGAEERGQPVELVVDGLLVHYRVEGSAERPVWILVKRMQQQAMVYMNIIDQLKSGKEPTVIKKRFEELELVPKDTLPNPDGLRLLNRALDKVNRYREALVAIVRRHGRTLVFDELDFARELTPSVALEIGFPPAVSIGVEFSGR